MKRGGRKTLLTKPLQRKIERFLAQGHSIKTVAAMAGPGERTFYEWCEKHPQFSQAATRALARSKIALVNKVRLADDWRGAAFLLERRWPDEYGRVEVREIPREPAEKKINVAFILPDLKGKSLAEVANFPVITEQATAQIEPEPEPTAGERWSGDIGRLGRAEHDLPLTNDLDC